MKISQFSFYLKQYRQDGFWLSGESQKLFLTGVSWKELNEIGKSVETFQLHIYSLYII